MSKIHYFHELESYSPKRFHIQPTARYNATTKILDLEGGKRIEGVKNLKQAKERAKQEVGNLIEMKVIKHNFPQDKN